MQPPLRASIPMVNLEDHVPAMPIRSPVSPPERAADTRLPLNCNAVATAASQQQRLYGAAMLIGLPAWELEPRSGPRLHVNFHFNLKEASNENRIYWIRQYGKPHGPSSASRRS